MTLPDLAVTSPVGADGAPIVLLGPSLGTAAAVLWEDVVPILARRYRVSLWDLPGHGASVPARDAFSIADLADALAATIRELGGPIHYAGVSLGGAVGQQLVVSHGDLLRSAAIVCSGAAFGDPQGWHERAARIRAQGTPVLVAQQSERWFAPGSIAARPVITGRLLHTLADADDESYALCCEALADYDLRAALRDRPTPVLAMYGEYDEVSPRADAELIASTVANGRVVGVADASHLAPAEKPDEVAAELIRFFEEN
ncbi:alpha/beta hydrolase [Microbacterium sp. Marseille-Q6965]|uniref:alpha/beta hydrolase n=1 Tax=Microbacterium sp. Marseille-Q6965 TaxID=2965072 RepID=UPI0021B6F51F|nr:alpha/beta hydrolase [Microbacterium sp. Marseille-Q6965]